MESQGKSLGNQKGWRIDVVDWEMSSGELDLGGIGACGNAGINPKE